MAAARNRLDRFLARTLQQPVRQVRLAIVSGQVQLNYETCKDPAQLMDQFTHVALAGQVLQARKPLYVMLHKPVGVVCATRDDQHKTVIDLIDHPQKNELHIVGRLDLNSSGLVLLTNDGRWSEQLTDPKRKVEKVYRVRLKKSLTDDYISAFANGMFFEYENITTAPVALTILSTNTAELVLTEGRYHQIKRMFGRFRNEVLSLHRTRIGDYVLPSSLPASQWQLVEPVSV